MVRVFLTWIPSTIKENNHHLVLGVLIDADQGPKGSKESKAPIDKRKVMKTFGQLGKRDLKP